MNNPPEIQSAHTLFPNQFAIGDRPYITYAVVDWFPLQVGQHDLRAMLVREADTNIIAIPGVEPVVCFVPVPGHGHYGHDVVRPSILFWRGEFWIPVYSLDPEREEIAKYVYGDTVLNAFMFDVLVMVDVCKIPEVDLLKLRTAESTPWVP